MHFNGLGSRLVFTKLLQAKPQQVDVNDIENLPLLSLLKLTIVLV